jgi:hypothetical protein
MGPAQHAIGRRPYQRLARQAIDQIPANETFFSTVELRPSFFVLYS